MKTNRRHISGAGWGVWLAVLAVVATLGFVAAGYLGSRSDRALQALSLRNLLQWGIALNLHLVDNEDRLPEVGGGEASADLPLAWYNSLPAYIGQEPVTAIPADKRPKPGDPSIWMDPGASPKELQAGWGEHFFTLGMNYWLQPLDTEPAYKIYLLTDPARTVFLTQTAGARPGIAPDTVAFRYRGRGGDAEATVLFCDGHAETMSRAALSGYGTIDPEFSRHWRPFADAPDPDYNDVDIMSLPVAGEERTND